MRSENNDIRGQAEKRYKMTLAQSPDAIMHALLQTGRTHADFNTRYFCLTQLRSVISVPPENHTRRLFVLLGDDVKEMFKTELINGFMIDDQLLCRKGFADLIADVASILCTGFVVDLY